MNFLPHKDFKLAGKSFDNKGELISFAKNNFPHVFLFLENWLDRTEYLCVNTSGSTGKPKQIQLKKEYMVNSAKATGTFFNLKPKTSALLCLPVQYIAGKMMLVRAMVLGWHLDIVEASSNPLNNIKKHYDFSAMVPLQVYNSLDKIFLIKKLIVGGGVISKDLIKKINTFSTEIYATYGMTETITHIAVKPLNLVAMQKLNITNYRTLSNVKILKDKRNCLLINAPKVSDNIVVTNDLVEVFSDSEFEWIGRYDNIINSGGIKLIPEKIEAKLQQLLQQRFFIAGLPDDILGEKIVLLIEGKDKHINTNFFEEVLTKYEMPKEIFYIDQFVETETKKIQRQKTLDLLKI